jgi:hypothetical protein
LRIDGPELLDRHAAGGDPIEHKRRPQLIVSQQPLDRD